MGSETLVIMGSGSMNGKLQTFICWIIVTNFYLNFLRKNCLTNFQKCNKQYSYLSKINSIGQYLKLVKYTE